MEYFYKRTLAYLIDCFIAFGTVMLINQGALLNHVRGYIGISDVWFQTSVNMQLYVLSTISLPVWIYFSYFDSEKSQGTFGKRIFNLHVANDENKKISIGKAFARTILKLLPWEVAHVGVIWPTPLYYENEAVLGILPYAGLLLFIIYVASIYTNPNKRTIYDRIIGTTVSFKQAPSHNSRGTSMTPSSKP